MAVSRGVVARVRLERSNAVSSSSSSSSCVPTLVSYSGLKRSNAGVSASKVVRELRVVPAAARGGVRGLRVEAAIDVNGAGPQSFDYDVVIIGAGVGGHGAALHAVEKVMELLFLAG